MVASAQRPSRPTGNFAVDNTGHSVSDRPPSASRPAPPGASGLLAVDQNTVVNPWGLKPICLVNDSWEKGMGDLDDLDDDKWWKRMLTRWDNLSLDTKKVIVHGCTSAGILVCLALLRLLAGCEPLSFALHCK
jgi:hypothetical protein